MGTIRNNQSREVTKKKILSLIRTLLAQGENAFPSERELAVRTGGSRGVIRGILEELESQDRLRQTPNGRILNPRTNRIPLLFAAIGRNMVENRSWAKLWFTLARMAPEYGIQPELILVGWPNEKALPAIRQIQRPRRPPGRPTVATAAPTPAGRGSETTRAAVITDSAAHHKYPINDFALIPDYAVLDPELTRGLPPMLTATTGMDALTHAIEAYIGRSTTKLTRAMSEEAATRIVRSLYTAYENGGDMQARADMLRAAYCAGVSFTRSYVGYVHGVAHSLGGQYGVPHGLANAVILPYFLDAYGAACHQKLGRLARVAHVAPESASDREAAEAFIRWIREMNARMGIPEKNPADRHDGIPRDG